MAKTRLNLEAVEALALEALLGAGTEETAARSLARAVRAAEHDGMRSHGLLCLPIYCEHVRCGKVDGAAKPVVLAHKGAAVAVDAATGFAHPAIDVGFERLIPAAHNLGCAALTIRNSYNCGALGYCRIARDRIHQCTRIHCPVGRGKGRDWNQPFCTWRARNRTTSRICHRPKCQRRCQERDHEACSRWGRNS